MAFEHILDNHSWHFWGEGHDAVSMPLPVILKGNNGIAFFMSSEFHHDNQGMVVVEKVASVLSETAGVELSEIRIKH